MELEFEGKMRRVLVEIGYWALALGCLAAMVALVIGWAFLLKLCWFELFIPVGDVVIPK